MLFAVLIVALMAAGEYHMSDGFENKESRKGSDVREVLLMERIEDQPLGEYPAEVSLDAARTVAKES